MLMGGRPARQTAQTAAFSPFDVLPTFSDPGGTPEWGGGTPPRPGPMPRLRRKGAPPFAQTSPPATLIFRKSGAHNSFTRFAEATDNPPAVPGDRHQRK